MVNNVTRFKPKVMTDNKTMDAIFDVQKEEIQKLLSEIMRLTNNTFILSADVDGITVFEKILNMITSPSLGVEVRRSNVINKMSIRKPFTRQQLQKILENIYGKGNYFFEVFPNDFKIIIDIDIVNPLIYLQFSKDVRNIIPANMLIIYAIQYTYLYLKRRYNYNKLNTLTYGELSQYSTDTIKE